ncbi:MAG: FtsX-like permease family protein [Spirosomaceae bacterium]|jgi:putative ABC transport system permease protein|nr:FtsX-like permease family protein [Spirosomataceae bacterium]
MLKIFLKRILRGFLSNKVYTTINLVGIVIGLTVSFFTVNYLLFEFSYDASHKKAETIFRLARNYRNQGYSVIGFPNWSNSDENEQKNWIKSLKNTNGVVDATQFIISSSREFIELNQKRIETDAILSTNTPQAFVEIFDWNIIEGSFQDFHGGVNKVLLTESVANQLVSKNQSLGDLVNKTVKILGQNYQVAAVIKDVPKNSHFDFSIALNTPKIDYWGSRIYIETDPNVLLPNLTQQLNQSIANYNPRLAKDPLYKGHYLQAIRDIHFKSNILYESKQPGSYTYAFLIGIFAIFTVFITIFNYANLTLAIKSKQNKTIGVLKTMGAKSENIAVQFILEAVILSLIAVPLAVILVSLATPIFNALMDVEISTGFIENYQMFLILIVLAIAIGFVASIAPILLLAQKNTIHLFKNGLQKSNFQGLVIRKYLITAQFVCLISIASIAYFTAKQLEFIYQKDLGFRKSQVLFAYTSPEKQDLFQQKLRQVSGINYVGNGSSFGIMPFNQMTYKVANQETVFDDARQLYLDYEALKAYGVKTDLVFDKNSTRKTIINRTAAKKIAESIKIPVEKLIGTTIITEPEYVNPANGQAGIPFVIDGIFEDIHLFSLREKIEPYFITLSNSVRMDGRSIVAYDSGEALKKIQNVYKELNEPFPLEISYLETNINQLYRQENKLNTLFRYFSFISIFLASLGIIGVTIFLTSIRTKEIGIRKILGASPLSISILSIKEYLPLVVFSLVLSFPIIYSIINQWLSGFAYRADIQYFAILPISTLVFGVIVVLVGIIAYNAAIANPVKSLKTE